MKVIISFLSKNRHVLSLGITAVTISSLAGLIAGLVLGAMSDTLALLPGLMILIPAAIGIRGAIFGAVGSRLGTALNTGVFELSFNRGSILRDNFAIAMVLMTIMSVAMGLCVDFISDFLGIKNIGVLDFVFISVVAGIPAGFILIFTNILIAYLGFKRSWDIDNISCPIITTVGDIITLPLLNMAAILMLDIKKAGWGELIDISSIVFMIATIGIGAKYTLTSRREVKRAIHESFPILFLCMLLFILAGTVIEQRLEYLITFPALLVFIPPFLDTGGNLGGILSSRLASKLHMGLIEQRMVPNRLVLEDFASIYLISLWVYPLLGFSIHCISPSIGLESPGALAMVIIATFSGLLIITILNIIAYFTAIYSYKLNLDPDNFGVPITTAVVDLCGAVVLTVVINFTLG